MFNVIDLPSGWKFDLIIRKSRLSAGPSSRGASRVGRQEPVRRKCRRRGHLQARVGEDGQSSRQIEDVAGILRVRSDLDRTYLERWLRELHVDGNGASACQLAGVSP